MLSRWLSGWPLWRARGERRGAAVYLSPRSVAAALAVPRGDRFSLDLRADPIGQLADAADVLREQARAVGLGDAECNLVLAPELYTVTLLERPPVPAEEVREAVRWRLQDVLDYSPDQAAIDVFPLPESASRERSMVFVVALNKEALKRLVDRVHGAGVRVGSVDVSELALRNIAYALHPEPDCSVGLLRLTPASGVVNVSRGDELFLSRRISGIPGEHSEAAWEGFKDRLLLQVQRSIDYYESAMGQQPCSTLVVATTHGWQDSVVRYLDDMLPVPVRKMYGELAARFDLHLYQGMQPEAVDWEAPSIAVRNALTAALPAVGGVLRPFFQQEPGAAASLEDAA